MYRGKRFPFTSFNSKRSSEAKRMSLYYTAGRERSRASSERRCDSCRSQREVGAAGSSLVGFGPAVLPSACKTTTSSSAVMVSTEKPHRFTQQTSVCVIRQTHSYRRSSCLERQTEPVVCEEIRRSPLLNTD